MNFDNTYDEVIIKIDDDILKDSPDYEDYTENVVIEKRTCGGCCSTKSGGCCKTKGNSNSKGCASCSTGGCCRSR